jgi:hypothetical protein
MAQVSLYRVNPGAGKFETIIENMGITRVDNLVVVIGDKIYKLKLENDDAEKMFNPEKLKEIK